GEFGRAFLVAKWLRIPMTVCLGTIVAERFGDFLTLLLLCVAVSQTLPNARFPIVPLAIGLTAAAAVIGVLVWRREDLARIQFKNAWLHRAVQTFARVVEG